MRHPWLLRAALLALMAQVFAAARGGDAEHVVLAPTTPARSILSMTYTFGLPESCDVDVVQTLVMNYTYGNFSSDVLFIRKADYDALQFDRIESDNVTIPFTTISSGDLYRIHYSFPHITAPATKTFIFTYKAIQATKTFSRSGSSSNSFSWETVVSTLPPIRTLNVVLNLYFHTASEEAIESSPQYMYLELQDKYTTIIFPTENNIPEGTSQTHQISFPKRVTCKPASSYKIVAIAVVAGSICFALVTTAAAVAIRKIKQRKGEQFAHLAEVT